MARRRRGPPRVDGPRRRSGNFHDLVVVAAADGFSIVVEQRDGCRDLFVASSLPIDSTERRDAQEDAQGELVRPREAREVQPPVIRQTTRIAKPHNIAQRGRQAPLQKCQSRRARDAVEGLRALLVGVRRGDERQLLTPVFTVGSQFFARAHLRRLQNRAVLPSEPHVELGRGGENQQILGPTALELNAPELIVGPQQRVPDLGAPRLLEALEISRAEHREDLVQHLAAAFLRLDAPIGDGKFVDAPRRAPELGLLREAARRQPGALDRLAKLAELRRLLVGPRETEVSSLCAGLEARAVDAGLVADDPRRRRVAPKRRDRERQLLRPREMRPPQRQRPARAAERDE
mmetsp:Transcript_3964/g.11214  ORF Transcript_3964/g.11214 Transcript_3964/m.11214 type:complete len:347 (-) Transcript_3964:888-1928(-)